MIHYGDITKIKGSEVPIVDIITGGSPCQDLSIAGKRAGLDGERSGLFMEQIRIIKEMREYDRRNRSDRTNEPIRPRYMVWENVKGAFSSNNGEDFRTVLEETAKVADENASIPRFEGGYKWTPSGCILGSGWSIAWRLHDAQFWGVPQRRKRIALVADFDGDSAPEILFERKGVSGDFAESAETGKEIAGVVGENADPTICLQGNGIDRADTAGCNGRGWRRGGCYTLNTIDRPAVLAESQDEQHAIITYGVDCYNQTQAEEVSKSLSSAATDSDHVPCVYGIDRASFNQGQNAQYDFSVIEEQAQTLISRGPGGVLTEQ